MSENKSYIPNRLKNASKEHPYVAGAVDIIDDRLSQNQQDVNAGFESAIAGLNDQNYVTVEATDEDTSIESIMTREGVTPQKDTVYRVGFWDGEQYDESKYSEYAWNEAAEEWKLLDVKEYTLATADDFIEPDAEKRAKVVPVGAAADVYGSYAENPEFVDIKLDNDGKILEATKLDGTKSLPVGYEIEGNAVKAVKNHEFVEAKLDAAGKIIEATRKDGTVFFGGGVEVESAVVSTIKSPEWIAVWVTSDKRILFGVRADGAFDWGVGIPQSVQKYIQDGLNKKVDGEYIENPEYINVKVDNDNKILEGIKENGTKVFCGNVQLTKSLKIGNEEIAEMGCPEFLSATTDAKKQILEGIKDDGKKYLPHGVDLKGADVYAVDNPEWAEVTVDRKGNIIIGIRKDGTFYIGKFGRDTGLNQSVEYPIFIGKTINEANGSLVPSTDRLVSTLVYTAKGDRVIINDPGKIAGIIVYEYEFPYRNAPLCNSGLIAKEYEIANEKTKFIRIVGIPSTSDPLMINGIIYGNSSFVGNIGVVHCTSVYSELDTSYVASTIPSGWYVSNKSEFSTTPQSEDPYENTGVKLTLQQIYDVVRGLANDYPDYVTLETLGYDSSEGKEVREEDIEHLSDYAEWLDENGKLHMPVYRLTLEPPPVTLYGSSQRQIGPNNNTLPTICISAGIHANEPPCMRAILNMLIHICRDWRDDPFLSYLRWHCKIVCIPVDVPYAYVRASRTNYNGVNVNRNWYWGGRWYDLPEGSGTGNYKGSSPLSEIETKYVYRMDLENADSVVYIDCHTYGYWETWKEITVFEFTPYCPWNREMQERTALEIIKGITVSGWKNHKLPENLIDKSGERCNYIGTITCSDSIAGAPVAEIDLNIPTITAECLYKYHESGGPSTVYNTYTDCMNEEYYTNTILCSLRNKFRNFINF